MPSSGKTGLCALCLAIGPLRNSHIISEFLYSSIYDDKHRFHVIEAGQQYTDFKQNGYYEPLLCQKCETIISVWETYARGLLLGRVPFRFTREENVTWVQGIDYLQFKLFQLSILWRASAAKGGFFSKVTLGRHEERLRKMLLAKDPGESWQYGCMMIGIHRDGEMQSLMVQPTMDRDMDATTVRFTFGGYFWAYRVADQPAAPPGFHEAVLQQSGKQALMFKDVESGGIYQAFLRKHAEKLKRGGV